MAYFDASYGPLGESFMPKQGSLEQFFVENYRFYVAGADEGGPSGAGDAGVAGGTRGTGDIGDARVSHPGEQLFYGDVVHPPWELYEADIDLRSTNLFEVNGFEYPSEAPLAHYSPGVPVEADRIRTLD
jgi:hypothetical protein